MKKREDEVIEQLTKSMSREDKKAVTAFLKGKREISGKDYKKFAAIIGEYNRIMKQPDKKLIEFMQESARPYKRTWRESGEGLI